MKQRYGFSMMLLPLFVLIALGLSMLQERSGIDYEISYPPMNFLPPKSAAVEEGSGGMQAEVLVLFDSQDFAAEEHVPTVLDVLDSMRVNYDSVDINLQNNFNFQDYEAVVVSFLDYDKISAGIFDLVDWVENGGKAFISIRPDPSRTYASIYRKLGVISLVTTLQDTRGVTFVTDLFPGTQDATLGLDFLHHTSYPVDLEADALAHLISADEARAPILWEYNFGDGKFVVINSDQFTTKVSRGVIGAGYSLLYDAFAYPVINSSIFFIDDFPSPILPGSNEVITRDYSRDIQSFFINVWWPDLQGLSTKYGVKYTGTIIETYVDETDPPFEKQPEIERFQYFGALVLDDGGEVGLHGYNHVPLCLEGSGVNQALDYPVWPTPEAIELSIFEVYSFSSDLFPDNTYTTYVPASNILCQDVRRWLPQALPELKVISSVYLPAENGLGYQQEFEEAMDNIIELPRITSGYELTSYLWWATVNELVLHFINSHYVHPGDVLHIITFEKGWEEYQNQFENYVGWLAESAPGLRNMTAKEGAMAVQRFDRIVLNREYEDDTYILDLDNFYDEAQILLRALKEPISIDGGTIIKITSTLYLIEASDSIVTIQFAE